MHVHACRVHVRPPDSRRAFHSVLLGPCLRCPWSLEWDLGNVDSPQKPSRLLLGK